jgi:hypothetical protein
MAWLQNNSAAVQAVATIILVAITAWYAITTRSLASQAKRQADAATDAQPDLVRRHALLVARSELLAKLDVTLGASAGLSTILATIRGRLYQWSALDRDHALAEAKMVWDDLETSIADLGSQYLQDYVGPFPLSDTTCFQLEAMSMEIRHEAVMIQLGLAAPLDIATKEMATIISRCEVLESRSEVFAGGLVALRRAVSTTGYARACGEMEFSDTSLPERTTALIELGGKWSLAEDRLGRGQAASH